MTNELQTVGAMHQCRAGEPYSTCVHCGALAEALNKPCPHFMRDAAQKLAAVASPTPQADSAQAADPWRDHLANQADMIDCAALQRAMVLHGISFPEGGMEHFRAALGEMVNRFVHFAAPQGDGAPATHGDDVAVDVLSGLMKAKLAKQRAKGYGGWDSTECTQQHLSNLLRAHVDKGDPVDVANFCAFLSARGEGIVPQADSQPAPDDFQPCPSCFGKGVEGDADDYGHTIDVTCGECDGSGRAKTKADSQPVRDVEREAFKAAHRHLELDEVPDAWRRPMFKHSHVEASWLGWIARAARASENGQPEPQGNELLTVAERNIRSFLRSATFKSESDREAALNCVDVLWAAARAPADSVTAPAGVTVAVGSQEFDLADTGARFTTADMATACGQAFREGLAAAPTPPAQAADSVLEDAARLEQIAEAIRDYHHALDMRKHGGLAENAAFISICNTMGMHWNRGEEAARRAARKQGGA